jgi:hypothetical protein
MVREAAWRWIMGQFCIQFELRVRAFPSAALGTHQHESVLARDDNWGACHKGP